MKQTTVQDMDNDIVYLKNTAFPNSDRPEIYYKKIQCKILSVTTDAIIYRYQGCKQGVPLHRVEYFYYGV